MLDEGPAIVYNVPGRTGQDIPDEVVCQLAAHPNFLGVKECTGNARIQVPAPCDLWCPCTCFNGVINHHLNALAVWGL